MANAAAKISFVSLGCPKALVDSERIVTHLRPEGYELAREHRGADMVIVNACGFLETAPAASLEAIGNAHRSGILIAEMLQSERDRKHPMRNA